MLCQKCGQKTKVLDSRPVTDGTRRRRKCVVCGHRSTSYETAVDAMKMQRNAKQILARLLLTRTFLDEMIRNIQEEEEQ